MPLLQGRVSEEPFFMCKKAKIIGTKPQTYKLCDCELLIEFLFFWKHPGGTPQIIMEIQPFCIAIEATFLNSLIEFCVAAPKTEETTLNKFEEPVKQQNALTTQRRSLGVSFKILFGGMQVDLVGDTTCNSDTSCRRVISFATDQIYLSCGFIPSMVEENVAILPRNTSFQRLRDKVQARNEAPIATNSPAVSFGI